MNVVVGVSLALLVGLMGTWAGLDRERSFYVTVLMVVGSYYVLFATMGGPSAPLFVECAGMSAFVIAAITGFKRTMWLVVAGLAGHGVFDIFHPHVISNPGVPEWWPGFCSAYDLAAALYLGVRMWRAKSEEAHFTPRSSTSNSRSVFGAMTPPAPRSP